MVNFSTSDVNTINGQNYLPVIFSTTSLKAASFEYIPMYTGEILLEGYAAASTTIVITAKATNVQGVLSTTLSTSFFTGGAATTTHVDSLFMSFYTPPMSTVSFSFSNGAKAKLTVTERRSGVLR
jgi:hypothetical protein